MTAYSRLHIRQKLKSVNSAKWSLAIPALTLMLTGCSLTSTFESAKTDDEVITASVTKPVRHEGINSGDAEIIKTIVVGAEGSGLLAWQNPNTGNKGDHSCDRPVRWQSRSAMQKVSDNR